MGLTEKLIDTLKHTSADTITVTYRSEIKTPRTCELHDSFCEKEVTCKYAIGNDSYADRVNDILADKGESRSFRSGRLPFGEWEKGCVNKVIVNPSTNEHYIRCYDIPGEKPTNRTYYVDGRLATSDEIDILKGLSRPDYNSNRQSDAGIDKKEQIKTRTLKFSNITYIEVGGVVFRPRR